MDARRQPLFAKIAPEDGDLLDMSKTGRPELYWADFGDKGAVVHLWPVPDRKYAFFTATLTI